MRLPTFIGKKLLMTVFFLPVVSSLSAQIANPPAMVEVKGGTFKMGNKDGYEDEQPVHNVTLSDFSIGKYEVTVAQYKQIISPVFFDAG